MKICLSPPSQLGDVIPNPWWSYDYARQIVDALIQKYSRPQIAANFVRLIVWTKQQFEKQRTLKAREAFERMVDEQRLLFLLLHGKGGYNLPSRIQVRGANMLHHGSNMQVVQKSLFDFEPDEEFNGEERAVALFLDKQSELLWWYRNRVGEKHYSIQGWESRKVYPDFIAAKQKPEKPDDYSHIYVLEYKGKHLKGNADTVYKQELLQRCDDTTWEELGEQFAGKKFRFQLIYQDEYEQVLGKAFSQ